ncbi:MAG: winged helix-turn-helix domain-containing protein [Bacteroidia bacterium]|nr:winged helix-turn-helix domain-containing protein [Bacteroidia bacterium]
MEITQNLQDGIHTSAQIKKGLKEQAFLLGYDFLVYPPTHEIAILEGFEVKHSFKVEPRLMQVLICLAEDAGNLVPRSELIKKVWNNYGGAEEGLMQAISKLRKFLLDDARQQQVIQTIPKKGYRLVPAVKILDKKTLAKLQGTEGEEIRKEEKLGAFTGFIERLTRPRFFLAFLFLSVVVIFILSILSYMSFWIAVAL